MLKIRNLLNYIFIDDTLKEDIEFLKHISVFCGLNNHSLAKIALIVFKKNYLAGETIYKEKQEADVLYIVKKGEISVKSLFIEKTVAENDFFGETSLIDDRRHNSEAKALKDSELYLIYKVKFNDLIESNPAVGLKIMKNLSLIFDKRLKPTSSASQD